jgi:hypothetical protein
MRLNLYIPTEWEREWWEKYAAKEGRSLSQFIRQAVRDHIVRVDIREKERKINRIQEDK